MYSYGARRCVARYSVLTASYGCLELQRRTIPVLKVVAEPWIDNIYINKLFRIFGFYENHLLFFQLLLDLSGAEFNYQYCHDIPLRFNPYFLILAYHG